MIKNLFIFSLLFVINKLVLCIDHQTAKLVVVKKPSYLAYDLNQESSLKLSDFKNLLLATSGFSIDKAIEWNGLKKEKTTEFPRATVLFLVDSNQTNINAFSVQTINVNEDTDLDFNYLKESISGYDSIVKFFDHLPTETDLKNLQEDCAHLSSFHIIRLTQSDSDNLAKSIDRTLKGFYTDCVSDSNDLLVYLLAANVPIRIKRQANPNQPNLADKMVTNEAVFYSDQYPAMFNIIFWTSLILALAVYGIAYGMWNMDPGLDTVIYRMTSQRIKKDQ